MLIIKLVRFILGFVSFEAVGGFPERLVNLCNLNKIPVWNIKKSKNAIWADTTIKGFKKIRVPSHRSGVKIRITKKHGLPFFINRNKKRFGLVLGLCVSVFVLVFLSTMVWSISVTGNQKLSSQKILSVFESVGIKKGCFKKAIVPEDVADEACKLLPELRWASVNIKGSHVEIVVSERIEAPDFPEINTPCNLVAGEDGLIYSVEANIGKEKVTGGDSVLKGDILISGTLDRGEAVAARGRVLANVQKHINIQYEEVPVLRFHETQQRKLIYFFGIKIPLGLKITCGNYCKNERYLTDGKTTLPVGIFTESGYSLEETDSFDEDEKELYLAEIYAQKYREILSEGEIQSSLFTYENAAFQGEYTVKKDIAVIG